MRKLRDEILEYPYTGVITRVVEGTDTDEVVEIYNGVMDETMVTDNEGRALQTSSYIVSIPLTKDDQDNYIIPLKGDEISLERYGQTVEYTVNNAEPSQLGGVSIHVTRKEW